MYPLPLDPHVFTISSARANSFKRRLRMLVSMGYLKFGRRGYTVGYMINERVPVNLTYSNDFFDKLYSVFCGAAQ
jgi:hypothetical protein